MTKEESAKLLDKAALICVTKHAGQRDKMGCAYFQHPMRVAMRCNTDEEKIVALLHDTIEDSDTSPEYLLSEGFPPEVVEAILSVTKREGESYEDFVARAKQNPLGRVVKLHDLEDNLDMFRLGSISPIMAARFNKYLAAHDFLLNDELTEIPERNLEDEILKCLRGSGTLTAREIALYLGVDKRNVNHILYDVLGKAGMVAQNQFGWYIP